MFCSLLDSFLFVCTITNPQLLNCYLLQSNAKTHFALTFFKECLQESKDILDDEGISEIIKLCNVIKNDKLQAAKRKVKGQAQKSKKKDKEAEKKAKKMATELYGDNDYVDDYDDFGAQYEDDFF